MLVSKHLLWLDAIQAYARIQVGGGWIV